MKRSATHKRPARGRRSRIHKYARRALAIAGGVAALHFGRKIGWRVAAQPEVLKRLRAHMPTRRPLSAARM